VFHGRVLIVADIQTFSAMRMAVRFCRDLTFIGADDIDAVRDSDFHTIFNFKENASQTLTGIPVGSKLLIEGRSSFWVRDEY
jgi:hypothetical protein